jgi:two-component system NtrC family sensor kinase
MGMVLLLGIVILAVLLPQLRDASREKFRGTALIIAKAVASDATVALTTEDRLTLLGRMMTYKQADEDIAYIFICDSQGKLLLHTFGQSFPRDLLVANVLKPGEAYGILTLRIGDEIHDDLAVPIFRGQLGTVHVGMSWKNASGSLQKVMILAVLATLGVIAVGGILMLIVTGRIMKPLDVLRQEVEALSEYNLDRRVAVSGRDEIGSLAGAFNHMIERLKASRDERARAYADLQDEIRQRQEIENSLRKSEAEKAAILNGLKNVLVEYVDLDMKMIWANQAVATEFGVSGEDLPGKHCFNISQGRNEPCPGCTAVKALQTGEPQEGEITVPDGRVYVVRSNPVKDADGKIIGIVHAGMNITHRKQEEQALRESQEFINKIINSIRDPILVQNAQHRFVMVNDAFCELVDKPRENILGKTVRDNVLNQAEADIIWNVDEQVLTTGRDSTNEERISIPPNQTMIVQATKSLHVDTSGRRFMVNVIHDVTELRRSEEALRESQEFLNKIINSIRDPILVEDAQHRFVLANDAFCTFVSSQREEILGKTVRDTPMKPEEIEGIWNVDEQVLTTGCDNMTEEHIFLTSNLTKIAQTCKSLYVDPAGRRFVVGVIHDVTVLRQSEEALRDSQEKYRSIVDNLGIGVSLISPQMEVMELNNQMRKWFPNIKPEEGPLCYQQFNDPPREAPCSYCPTRLTLQDGLVHESTTETPAGDKTLNYRIVSSPIKDAEGNVVAAVEMVEDITERRQMEREIQKSRELLEQRVRERTTELVEANHRLARAQVDLVQREKMSMLGQLSAGVAHEMNTPVGAIMNVMADGLDHLRGFVTAGQPIFEMPDDARQWVTRVCIRMLASPANPGSASRRKLCSQIEREIADAGFENPRRVAAIIAVCFAESWPEEPSLVEYLSQEPILKILEHLNSLKNTMEVSTISAQKVSRIVRALGQYSHSGQDELSEVNIGESIDNTLAILQNRIKHIADIKIAIEPGLPVAQCMVDISQIWTNILNNACDAIESVSGGQLGLIEIVAMAEGEQIVVEISNSGPPIPEEILPKIYDPFFTTKPVGKGTGLGLGICVGILQRFGGAISARNDTGKVTFQVRLPMVPKRLHKGIEPVAPPAAMLSE